MVDYMIRGQCWKIALLIVRNQKQENTADSQTAPGWPIGRPGADHPQGLSL